MVLEVLFGKKKTLKEVMRENKREINRSIRDLDRERTALERQQEKLIKDIKKAATDGQMGSVRTMAKDLVRCRQYVTKFYLMKSNLQAVSLKLEMAKSSEAMTRALVGVTKATKAMNKNMDPQKLQKIMMEFERENAKAEMQGEMMEDAMDDAFADEADEEEEEKIVGQVLDEIGITFEADVPSAPLGLISDPASEVAVPPAVKKTAAAVGVSGGGSALAAPSPSDPAISELEARLNNLRRDGQ